jgi:tetratricopeptide (TPR) repeat protein
MPLEALVRFGRWDEILAEPMHPAKEVFTHAFQFAARGIAFAAKGDIKSAREEQARYAEATKAVTPDRTFGNNPCQAILDILTPMLEGEILLREGKVDEAIAQLRAAIAEEDKLRYDEPPGWMIPVRHSLGAALMAHRRFAEAEAVYREDLALLPGNGWSLFGLAEALMQQGKPKEVTALRSQFKEVWRKADLTITSSCLCQPGG